MEIKEKVEQREEKREVGGELDKETEMRELEMALKKAENGKAAGEDGCINEILKMGGEPMKRSLLVLFQTMWREEKVPIDWARGIIVPIFKERR